MKSALFEELIKIAKEKRGYYGDPGMMGYGDSYGRMMAMPGFGGRATSPFSRGRYGGRGGMPYEYTNERTPDGGRRSHYGPHGAFVGPAVEGMQTAVEGARGRVAQENPLSDFALSQAGKEDAYVGPSRDVLTEKHKDRGSYGLLDKSRAAAAQQTEKVQDVEGDIGKLHAEQARLSQLAAGAQGKWDVAGTVPRWWGGIFGSKAREEAESAEKVHSAYTASMPGLEAAIRKKQKLHQGQADAETRRRNLHERTMLADEAEQKEFERGQRNTREGQRVDSLNRLTGANAANQANVAKRVFGPGPGVAKPPASLPTLKAAPPAPPPIQPTIPMSLGKSSAASWMGPLSPAMSLDNLVDGAISSFRGEYIKLAHAQAELLTRQKKAGISDILNKLRGIPSNDTVINALNNLSGITGVPAPATDPGSVLSSARLTVPSKPLPPSSRRAVGGAGAPLGSFTGNKYDLRFGKSGSHIAALRALVGMKM
jgi:hypothetical protein